MNFDVNTLSTLMQLMGAQKPRESEANYNSADNADTNANANFNNFTNMQNMSAQNGNVHNMSQSVFAMQNGLGQRVDLAPKQNKQSLPSSNPMSALFDMMSGKGSSGNADMMSGLMPMLMNMMSSKPAQVAQNTGNNERDAQNKQSFEQKLQTAKNNAEKSADSDVSPAQNCTENSNNRQSNAVDSNIKCPIHRNTRDRYDPITFAGYTLISSLNKLYALKKSERLQSK